jgi:hypothetical protein
LPANLTAEAKAKWQLAENAKNPREKLQALQEFLSEVPKHKGNERLRAQVKTKIAELRQELIDQRRKHGGGRSPWSIDREGAAQVMIFGGTQSGKSSFLKSLTNARVEVRSHDYSTQRPIPGMLQYEDIQIQLVELPAPQYIVGEARYQIQTESAELLRQCDGLLIVLDLANEPLRQLQLALSSLEAIRVSTRRASTTVEIVPEKGGGEIRLAFSGPRVSLTHEQVSRLLHSYGIKNALVRIFGNATTDDVEDAILQNVTLYKPTLLVANKVDLELARKNLLAFQSTAAGFQTATVSCLTGQGLKEIGSQLFNGLGIVRIYTKEPNEPRPSEHPFVVRSGTTVRELARSIHSDLADKYRYSRIWGPTSKFAGERVGPEHVLGDRDIVEIHTS